MGVGGTAAPGPVPSAEPLVTVVPTAWQGLSRTVWPCCVVGLAAAVFVLTSPPSFAVVAVPFMLAVLYAQLRVVTRYCDLMPDGRAVARSWTSRIVSVDLHHDAVIRTPRHGVPRWFVGWTITGPGGRIYLPPFPLNYEAFLAQAEDFGAVIEA